jgi:hypothetical protein
MAGVPARSVLAALLAGVFAGLPASASDKEVQVELTGKIEPTCKLARGGESGSSLDVNLDLGRLDDTTPREVRFSVDCNTPFEYRMASANGGFQHETRVAGTTSGLMALLPYRVDSTIQTDRGPLNLSCESDKMIAAAVKTSPCMADSGEAIAINREGLVTVSWGRSRKKISGGKYSDTLTLWIGAKP